MIKRDIYLLAVCALSFFITSMAFSTSCENCKGRGVNPQVYEMLAKAKTGDLVLVDSADFFSKAIADFGGCHFSSAKIVYRSEGKLFLVVSDTGDLSDVSDGLTMHDAVDYFSGYDKVNIALYRPNELSSEHQQRLDALVARANRAMSGEEVVEYDLTYNNDNRSGMTCQKIVIDVFDEYLVDRSREQGWMYGTTLPCDLRLENMQQIGAWINYWK